MKMQSYNLHLHLPNMPRYKVDNIQMRLHFQNMPRVKVGNIQMQMSGRDKLLPLDNRLNMKISVTLFTCGSVGCNLASVILTRRENWCNLLLLHNLVSRFFVCIVMNANWMFAFSCI